MNRTAVMLGVVVAAISAAGLAHAQMVPDRAARVMERLQARGDMAGLLPGRPGLLGGEMILRAADANQDGVATRLEVEGLLQEEFIWRDRNSDGVLDEADGGPLVQRLAELRDARPEDPWARPRRADLTDADGDNRITAADIGGRVDRLFGRLDADADNAITAEEARSARAERFGDPGSRR